ncbi:MAG: DegT/DnrJ/EryC1/StrS family aminotransferase, partial [Candidatus Omnitrophota bacterium]
VLKLNLERLKIGRDRFIVELARRGVAASVHFIPLYRHSFYKEKFGYQRRDFPASEWLFQRILSLPIYPSMSGADVDQVIRAVREITSKFGK